MRKLLIATLFLGILSGLALGSSVARACSCAPPPAPKVALEQSAAVFAGKVIAIKNEDKQFRKVVTFEVSRVWKGLTSRSIIVTTGLDGAICGFSFEVNQEYLVYASAMEGREHLQTSICSRTKGLQEAKEDLAELGEGSVPPAQK